MHARKKVEKRKVMWGEQNWILYSNTDSELYIWSSLNTNVYTIRFHTLTQEIGTFYNDLWTFCNILKEQNTNTKYKEMI